MRIVSFAEETAQNVIARLSALAGPGSCTRQTIPIAVGTVDVSVIRGGPIEKASLTTLHMQGVVPPEATGPIDYMVFQLEIFPCNPRCPMGHFNTEWSLSGPGPYHMNMDVFPAIQVEEDIAALRACLDRVAARHGRDPAGVRDGLADHYGMAHFDCTLAACAGCKLMHQQDPDLDLFIDAYRCFLEAYLDLLARYPDTPASPDETQAKLRRNGKWLEYLTLKDVAVKMGLAAGIPPEVIVDLSFPPSAAF